MTDREAKLLDSLKTANDLLGQCDQYISAEPTYDNRHEIQAAKDALEEGNK